jgi:hypothetical protein
MELASICRRAHTELEGTAILSRSRGRDRWFESTFLERRVCKPSVPLDVGGLRGGFFARATSPRTGHCASSSVSEYKGNRRCRDRLV